MLLVANKARSALTGSVTAAAGQVASITATTGALFVGVGSVATSTFSPMRCVLTAVDANGNDTGAIEIVDVTRSGDNLTLVTRGLEGTTPAAWVVGTVIECRPTAGGLIVMGPSGVVSGIGQSGLVATAFTSLMPSSAPVSIPAGTLAAGDAVIVEGVYGKIGTTTAWTPEVALNTFFGSIGNFGAGASNVAVWFRFIIAIRTTTEQTISGIVAAGGGFFAPNQKNTFNTGTTPLTIDVQAKYNSAPVGGETIQLDWYSVSIKRAG